MTKNIIYSIMFAATLLTGTSLRSQEAITPPYVEHFDSYNVPLPVLPDGWVYNDSALASGSVSYPRLQWGTSGCRSNLNYLDFKPTAGDQVLVAPFVQLQANRIEVLFWARLSMAGYEVPMQVGYVYENNSEAEFHPVQTVMVYSTDYMLFAVPFTDVDPSQEVYVAFKVGLGTGSDVYLDDVTIRESGNCPTLTGLAVTDNTQSGQVSLAWTDEVNSQWQILYGPTGFDPEGEDVQMVDAYETNYDVSSLDDEVTYDFYVTALCDDNTNSNYLLPVTARPNTYAMNGADTVYSCGLTIVDNGGLDGNYASNSSDVLVLMPGDETQTVHLHGDVDFGTASGARLSIYNGVGTDGRLLATFTQSDYDVDITSSVGAVTLVFTSMYLQAPGYQFYADCRELMTCAVPYDLEVNHVAANSAVVEWGYEYEVSMPEVFNLTLTDTMTGTSTSYSVDGSEGRSILTELTERTAYRLTVQASCGGTDTSLTLVTDFTTACYSGGEVTTGTGNTYAYAPSYSGKSYVINQHIYSAAELGNPTSISGMSLELRGTEYTAQSERYVKVYLDTTSLTAYTSTAAIKPQTDENLVYSGTYIFRPTEVNHIVFDSPYAVPDIAQNIVLTIFDSTGTPLASNAFTTASATMRSVQSSVTAMSDSEISIADVSTLTALTGSDYALSFNRLDVTFTVPCDESFDCVPPNVVDVEPGTTTVDLGWIPGYDEMLWNVEYRLGGTADDWEMAADGTEETQFTIEGLQPATDYEVRVSSVCWPENLSITLNVVTLCAPDTVPFREGFENFTAATYPAATERCWYRSVATDGGNSSPDVTSVIQNGTAHEGNLALCMRYVGNWISLPQMEPALHELSVSFWMYAPWASYGDYKIAVGVMETSGVRLSFVPVDTVTFSGGDGTWQKQVVDLEGYTGPGGHICLVNIVGQSWIDELEVKYMDDCRRVTNLAVEALSTTSVNLTFSGQPMTVNYTIRYGNTDDVEAATDSVVTADTAVTLTQLQSGLPYYAWICSNCDTASSRWRQFPMFHTLCEKVVVTNATPYLEDFESRMINVCAETEVLSGAADWEVRTFDATHTYYYPSTAYSGSSFLHFGVTNGTTEAARIVLPTFDLTDLDGDAELTFERYTSEHSSLPAIPRSTYLKVYGRTSESMDWQLLDSLTTPSEEWQTEYVMLPQSAHAPFYQVAFEGYHPEYNGVNIDDISLHLGPACTRPTAVTVASDDVRATVRWQGPQGQYTVQYRERFSWTWETAATVTDADSLLIEGLEPMTDYEVRVRLECSTTELSVWSTVVPFRTGVCGVRVERGNDVVAAEAVTTTAAPANTLQRYTYSQVLVEASDLQGIGNLSGLAFRTLTPDGGYDFQSAAITLSYTYEHTLDSFLYDPDGVQVFVGSITWADSGWHYVLFDQPFDYDGVSNVVVSMVRTADYRVVSGQALFAAHQDTVTRVRYAYHPSQPVSPLQVNRLSTAEGSTVVPDYRFFSCLTECDTPHVSHVSVTEHSISIEWSAANGQAQVQYKHASETEWGEIIDLDDNYSYTAHNLNTYTAYDIRLRQVCAEGIYSDWAYVSATTLSHCPAPEGLQFEGMDGDAAVFSWLGATTGNWRLHLTSSNGYDRTEDVTTNPVTISGLGTGVYQVAISTICDGNQAGPYSTEVNFNTRCGEPTGIYATSAGTTVTVYWTADVNNSQWEVRLINPTDADDVHLYRASASPFTATDLRPATTYEVRVRSVCGDNWYSTWAGRGITATTLGIGDVDFEGGNIVVRPNPASVSVTLDGLKPASQVSLVDASGRTCGQWTAATNSLTLDLRTVAPGTYFIRITNDRQSAVRKLLVK